VKRNVSSGETWQVYGIGGELLAEYTSSGTQLTKEYGYRGGQLLITAAVASTGWGAPPVIHDNPLQVGVTTVQAAHITELRTAINNLRSHLGMSSYSWTTSATTSDYINASPIIEMRTALDQALGAPAAGYASGLASGQPIKAIHIQELRDRLTAASGSDIRWMVSDQLGTPRMIFDASGSLAATSRHDYLPFGEELGAGIGGRTTGQGYSASDGVRQHFTGYEEDSETGLNFAQARYHSPIQGRFTSVDPIMRSASVVDPQSFNRYTYVGNNPLNYVDPTGHQAQDPKSKDPKRDIENPDCTECDILYTAHQQPKKTPVVIGSVVEAPPQFFYEFRYRLGVPRTTPAPTAGGGGLRFLSGLAGAGAIILLNPTTLGGGDTCAGGCCTCGTTTATQPDTSANPNPNPEDNKPDTGDRTRDDDSTVVVRGGASPKFPLGQEISGAGGISLLDAASGVPHNQIWHTTAGEIRKGGGTVIPWPEPAYPGGPINGRHVRITLGRSNPFVGPIPNPVPKDRRVPGRP